MIRHAEGTLFDSAYLEPELHLWVRTGAGELIALTTPYAPRCYLAGPEASLVRATRALNGSPLLRAEGRGQRIDFWSGQPVPVLILRVLKPSQATAAVRRLLHVDHRLRAYDVDIDPVLSFHSAHDVFPLARVAVSWDEAGGQRTLRFVRALDDPWDPEYRVPELVQMTWHLERSPLVPLGGGNAVLVEAVGFHARLDPAAGGAAVAQLNACIAAVDPDVIVSREGDQHIMPWLIETAARAGVPLRVDRLAPPVERRARRAGRSIHVYSGLMYQAPDYPLLGRWHVDLYNSFFAAKARLEGVIEMARLSRLPVQHQARRSGGAAITAMEIHLALRRGILVPFTKDQVERFRSAAELLEADKGPLTYYPPQGLYEGVVELDFEQMYPSIMAVHNVSPETMNCPCCAGLHPVPGTSHHTCTRRRGLVPDALAGLLRKRLRYKRLKASAEPEARAIYEARTTALKWTLVTTFGYQGFHNAKFGLIEAHEAITAWGRESLLRAKEVFEGAGYRLLHALTDSLYVHKPAHESAELAALCAEVQARTGLSLAVEGTYDWLCFLPSKVRGELSVATRYFGRFSTGELKLRGIKQRQHATPPFIVEAQNEFLAIMQGCRSRAELEAAAPQLVAAYRARVQQLHKGQVPPEALAITQQVSKEASAYRSNAAVALCLRHLATRGIRIPPGEAVRYVIVDRQHRDPARRYLPEPFLDERSAYDASAY